MRTLFCAFALAGVAAAVPVIDRHGVRHAATGQRATSSQGALAPGGLFTVRGRGFGGNPGVEVTVGSARWRAEVVTSTETEIRARLPVETPPGYAALRVHASRMASQPLTIRVVPAAFGFLTARPGGAAVAAAVRRGQTIDLRGTGLGAEPSRTSLEVYVGGIEAERVTARNDHAKTGEQIVAFRIPAAAPSGCHVPVIARAGGRVSNTVSLPIEVDRWRCANEQTSLETLCTPARGGFVLPYRLSFRYDANQTVSRDSVGDALLAGFWTGSNSAACRLTPAPEGSCVVFPDLSGITAELGQALEAGTQRLDAGALSIGKAMAEAPDPRLGQHVYHSLLGGLSPAHDVPRGPLVFAEGPLVLRAGGGPAIAAFQVTLPFPGPIAWKDRAAMRKIDRSRPLPLHWEVASPTQPVWIAALTVEESSRSFSAFLCQAGAGRTGFTVPPQVLSVLPPTRSGRRGSYGILLLATFPSLPAVSVGTYSGLDVLLATGAWVDGRTVEFE